MARSRFIEIMEERKAFDSISWKFIDETLDFILNLLFVWEETFHNILI